MLFNVLLQKLATSCDVLSEKCVRVVKEQELQLQGWSAAVANSNTVLGYVIVCVCMHACVLLLM